MEATYHGIPVTSISCGLEEDLQAYLALGHHDPHAALAAMHALDLTTWGHLGPRLGTDLADRIRLCWGLFDLNPESYWIGGEELGPGWTVDLGEAITEATPGAVPVTVLDLTPPTTHRPDQGGHHTTETR
jgi:hypothetical protein